MVDAPPHPDYNSSASLKAYMDAMSLAMRKQYGQNFLVNKDARQRLSREAVLSPIGDEPAFVWEVGPGLGAMTEALLKEGARVLAFEIDRAFIASLKSFFGGCIESAQLRIVEGDVLKTWEREAARSMAAGETVNLFGNLPYNIAATLIASVIERSAVKWGRMPFEKCVITVQKEVAERMTAKAGGENYSSLSVICQWAYKVRTLFDLPPAFFWPRPRVASRSLVFERREEFPRCKNAGLFVKMTRSLFASRRKTIRNNLARFLSCTERAEEVLEEAGIQQDVRAETLGLDTLLRISDIIAS